MRTRPRFIAANVAPGAAEIAGDELHHMRDVMRLRPGDEIILLDNNGAEYAGRIREFTRGVALIDCGGPIATRPRIPIILGAAIVKRPRMDFLIEKAVELGTSEIWPLKCAYGQIHEIGAGRLARWRRIAAAAAKQSCAPIHPMIHAERDFAEILDSPQRGALGIICVQGGGSFRDVLSEARPERLILLCGPEGGFSADELRAASNAGFIRVSLGPNRLRAETAALAALSITAAMLDGAWGEISGV
ncbi:MAG: RsmE family RNA methyltransferase [Candidatus Binataceae bacterium]